MAIFFFFTLLLSFLSQTLSSPIHDLLLSHGLPAGLLPKKVSSFTLSPSGLLHVHLDQPCFTKIDNNAAFYDTSIKANLTFRSLSSMEGLSQEELFVWLPVKDIVVDDPKSGLIVVDIGMARKQLSLSLFEEPPDCQPGHGASNWLSI